MSLTRALTLQKVYRSFSTEPLPIESLDGFYLSTTEARGGDNPRRQLARILRENNAEKNLQFLFVGYKGCGKSTEMNHLQRDLQDDFLVLNYSVQKELDPANLSYIELFIVTMEMLFDEAERQNLNVSDAFLKKINNWIASKEIEEINEKYNISGELEAGTEGNWGIPYLQKFFHKFKISAKSSRSLKEVLTTNVEPKLSNLIEHCNDLILELRLKLRKEGKTDLLIIVEDLDKIPFNRASDLFLNYANQLTLLKCNVIFTFPIALYHSRRFNEIKSYFSKAIELPMISVKNVDGSENQAGIEAMKEIVKKRIDLSLFEQPSILHEMVLKSGGVLRDLFLFVRGASEFALDADRRVITQADWKRIAQSIKKEYANNIADDYEDEDGVKIEALYETLVNLHENPQKQLDNTVAAMQLRQSLCILGYNGTGWCDVHPLVLELLRERGKI
jgi:hypothetical protein